METTIATRGSTPGLSAVRRPSRVTTRFARRAVPILTACILLSLAGSACQTGGGPTVAEAPPSPPPPLTPADVGPRAWIENPLDGDTLPAGEPMEFVAYATDGNGVAAVELRVNGESLPIGDALPATADDARNLVRLQQAWQPRNEGEVIAEARGRSTSGAYGEPAYVRFCVGDCQTETPAPVVTDTPVPKAETPSPAPTEALDVMPYTPRPPSPTPTEVVDVVPYTPSPNPTEVIDIVFDTPTPTATPTLTATPIPPYDLYVRRMDFSTDTPQVGETVQLYIMIATDRYPSQGPFFPASSFRWRQGAGFPWQEESCPPNDQYAQCTKTVQFSYQKPGIYQVQVEADHQDVVAETDETNNVTVWTVTVSQPPTVTPTPTHTPAPKYDIYVRRLDIQPPSPIAGELVQAYIMLSTDTLPPGAPYFPASAFRWREGTQFPWHEEACPDNWEYARCDKTVQFSYSQRGDYTVQVEADVYNQVDEANESNNSLSWLLSVGAAPTLTPSPQPQATVEFWASPPYVNAGQCTSLNWNVEGVQAVYLDGQPQVGQGSQQVCPCQNTTYTLQVVHVDNSTTYHTVEVLVSGSCEAPTNTPAPPAQVTIEFWADPPYINAGQCTTLRWNVNGVQAVYLDEEPQEGSGGKQVCHCETTTHTLAVVHTDNSITYHPVDVLVSGSCEQPTEAPPQVQDTSGPQIESVGVGFRSEPSCQFYGHAMISDPSGVAWAQFYFNLDGGGWQSVWMTDKGGGNYESEVGVSIFMTTGSLDYYVIASDTLGNGSETGATSADYWMCGGG